MNIGAESSIKSTERALLPKQSAEEVVDPRDTVMPDSIPQWAREEPIETWPESEPPDAETLRPPAGDAPEELPPDSDDMRDTVPSPPPPAGSNNSG